MSPSLNSQAKNGSGHHRFRELCAVYSSGSLSQEEIDDLKNHVVDCAECRVLLQEYNVLVRSAIPLMSDPDRLPVVSGFDDELAETEQRILTVFNNARTRGPALSREIEGAPFSINSSWRSVARSHAFALAVLVALCLGVAGGFILASKRLNHSSRAIAEQNQLQPASRVGISEPTENEGNRLLEQRDEQLKTLSAEVSRLQANISQLKQSAGQSESLVSQQTSTISTLNSENAALNNDRNQIAKRLQEEQTRTEQLTQQIDDLKSQHDLDGMRAASIQESIDELKMQIRSQAETISEQERLLAADRDIRELMGARDLLLADVFDIGPNGKNKKAFGRIFYTEDKSLIFYAFDLDHQPGIRNAAAFQVWGARAADNGKGSAFNMGIFYMDNEAQRRWVLKFDDPKILQLHFINSVRNFGVTAIAKIVYHEHANSRNGLDRFTRPLLNQMRWYHRNCRIRSTVRMDVDCSEGHQSFASSAFGNDCGSLPAVPAFRDSHDCNRLSRKRAADQALNARRNRIVKSLKRWPLLENSVSEFPRKTFHICEDVGYVVVLHEVLSVLLSLPDDHINCILS